MISVVVPVRNVTVGILEATLASVREQRYTHWEACLVDDASTDADLRAYLQHIAASDERIRLRILDDQRGISGATNAALDLARGEFVAFLDNDDLLAPDALAAVAEAVLAEPGLDLIYTDEDKVGLDGQREDPYFKPDWAPDLLMSCMYFGHLLVVRRALVERVGRLRPEFDGSQDYDLALRVVDTEPNVRHIPRVLYHWRRVPGSTAARYQSKPYADAAARRALAATIVRRHLSATVEDGMDVGSFRVRYQLPSQTGVSIILQAGDSPDRLQACVASLGRSVVWDRADLVIVADPYCDPAMDACLRQIATHPFARIERASEQATAATLKNRAARRTTGEVLLFLTADVEAETQGWLEAMLEHAQREEVGAVGCRLVQRGRRRLIAHAGVILGMRGSVGRAHRNRRAMLSSFYGPNRVTNYSAVAGDCLMLRRDVFVRVAGFDEQFGSGFDAIDLCLRVRHLGLRIVYTPFATLLYREQSSRSAAPVTTAPYDPQGEDARRMVARWGSSFRRDPFYNPNLPLDQEDFGAAIASLYPSPGAARRRRLTLVRSAAYVLKYEGIKSLAREMLAYIRGRV